MYSTKIRNMDLEQIANSGQCFRWKRLESDKVKYAIVAFGQYLEIEQDGTMFHMSCNEQEWNEVWRDYFDIDTDYEEIKERISSSDDEHLKLALSKGAGIRILKQDLWEIIVSFIISQNNNIKRITKSIDELCVCTGLVCDNCKELSAYKFPKPDEIKYEIFDDKAMGFGYRDAYLREIYQYASENPSWIDNLKKMSYEEAMNSLLQRKGIGKKVANCICLFGLHHVDAFPIDTHVKQLLDEHYPNGFDFERYDGVAGIVQQYLFYYELIKNQN